MTFDHSATAAYEPAFRGVTINLNAAAVADALAWDDAQLDRTIGAADQANHKFVEADAYPYGATRELVQQEGREAFADELGDVTITLSTTAALKLVGQLVQAVRQDPRLAPHPYLVELADCAVRRLAGAHALLSGAPGVVEIPAVPA
jgi:hypothetical protein